MAPSSDVMVEADNVNIHSSNVKVEAKDVKQEDTKQDLILSTSLSPRWIDILRNKATFV